MQTKIVRQNETSKALCLYKIYFHSVTYFIVFRFLKNVRKKLRKEGIGAEKMKGRKSPVHFVSNVSLKSLF